MINLIAKIKNFLPMILIMILAGMVSTGTISCEEDATEDATEDDTLAAPKELAIAIVLKEANAADIHNTTDPAKINAFRTALNILAYDDTYTNSTPASELSADIRHLLGVAELVLSSYTADLDAAKTAAVTAINLATRDELPSVRLPSAQRTAKGVVANEAAYAEANNTTTTDKVNALITELGKLSSYGNTDTTTIISFSSSPVPISTHDLVALLGLAHNEVNISPPPPDLDAAKRVAETGIDGATAMDLVISPH